MRSKQKLPYQQESSLLVKWTGPLFLNLQVIHDFLSRETAGYHYGRHACTGMRTRAGEIQIIIMWMFIARSEISQLSNIVTESVRRTFHQVISFAPRERRKIDLELDMRFEIGDSQA